MRRVQLCACIAGIAWLMGPAIFRPVSAQVDDQNPFIEGRLKGGHHFTPEAIREFQAFAATFGSQEVKSSTDVAIGTGEFLAILRDPNLLIRPTVLELRVNDQDIVVAEVVSKDNRFRHWLTFVDGANGPIDFYDGRLIAVESSSTTVDVFFQLRHLSLIATAGPTINSAFTFLESPTVQSFPDANISARLSSRSEITGFGQSKAVGDNVNVSAATPNQQFVVNFLRTPDERSGFIALCVAPGPCAVAGVGGNAGSYGRAAPGNVGAFGLVPPPNSVSIKYFIFQESGTTFGQGGCPPGEPDPPRLGLGYQRLTGGQAKFNWTSIECADSYILELTTFDGGVTEVPVLTAGWDSVGDIPRVRSFRVATVANGVRGQFSPVLGMWAGGSHELQR